MTKVAVVGLGFFSQFHLAAWQNIQGVDLVGATDLDAQRRSEIAATGVPVQADLAGLLDLQPDIVDIVAPPPAHVSLIRASLAPGRVIICQKPFCTTLEDARAITAEAAAAGTKIVVHENFRFQPWHRTVRAFLDSGRMGQVYSARFDLRPGDGRGPDAYLSRQPAFQTMPRLLIHETGVHFIDLFRWLFGDVTGVYADLRQLNPVLAGEDAGVLVMDHATGVRSTFDGNRLADHITDEPRRTMGEMWIEGEGGVLSLDGMGDVRFRPFGSQTSEPIAMSAPVGEGFGGGCVAALCDHVAKAVQTGAALENEAADYLPVIELTDLAYASAASGRKLPAGS